MRAEEAGGGRMLRLSRTGRPRAAPIWRNLLPPPTLGPAGGQGQGASWRACSLCGLPALVCTQADPRNFSPRLRNGPDSHRSLLVHQETKGTRSEGSCLNPRPGDGQDHFSGARSRLSFLATLRGLWHLRFSPRDKPWPPAGKGRALTAGWPGNSLEQTRER